jgi:iron complex outermembrane receptor protein
MIRFHRTATAHAVATLASIIAACFCGPARAQEAQRIEITGSSIKRIDAETALPVQVITRQEIERSGAINTEQLLQSVSALSSNQSLTGSSAAGATTGSISSISLRGLGSQRTLVLLNGRRIAPYGIGFTGDSVSVDVNSIPIAAIERVEVLKDGASAIYGSDAIAGVVNFILRRDVRGGELSADYGDTSGGGASMTRLSGLFGFGDLAKDRYNMMFMLSYQKEAPLFGRDRGFAASGIVPEQGNDTTSGNTFPANVFILNGDQAGATRNPAAGSCPPPYSVVDPLNNPTTRCRFDPSPLVSLLPKAQRISVFANLRFALTDSLEGFFEASLTQNSSNTVIQPVPLSDQFSLPSNNVLFNQAPYNGNYPNDPARFGALAGTPTGLNPGFSAIVLSPVDKYYPTAYMQSVVGAGNPLPYIAVRYRSAATGNRDTTDYASAPRITAGVRGALAAWDFDAAYLHTQSRVRNQVNDGYPANSRILPLLNSGNVNLWGPNDDATTAALRATNFVGDAIKITSTLDGVNVRGSRDLFALGGGPASIALGGEVRRERLFFDPNPTIQTGDISGYGGNYFVTDRQRTVDGLFSELNLPFMKGLEGNVAFRADRYQGVGTSTVPKFSLRWQPTRAWLLRTSIGNGFRAPSLQDLYLPNTIGVTGNGQNDPLRCATTGSSTDCQTQFPIVIGGNATLKPEKSKNSTLGVVLEPIAGASMAVDFWHVHINNEINPGIPVSTILGDLTKYGSLVTRGPVDPKFPTIPGPILSIDQTNINVGAEKITGLDIDAKASWSGGSLGKLTFNFAGTYLLRDDQQNLDGSWAGVIGASNSNTSGAIVRWRHFASISLNHGPWDFTLGQHYQGRYTDQASTITGDTPKVSAYETYDFSASYAGIKDMRLRAGMRNVFNKAPPYTNGAGQSQFQGGYDVQYGDPRGRFAYVGLTYQFK